VNPFAVSKLINVKLSSQNQDIIMQALGLLHMSLVTRLAQLPGPLLWSVHMGIAAQWSYTMMKRGQPILSMNTSNILQSKEW